MNFLEVSFPDNVSIGAIGGSNFSTTISTSSSKNELRSSNWMVARCSYKINCNILSDYHVSNIISLFNICRGKAVGFRYKDWSDYQALNVTIGTADGTTVAFQLKKLYIFGGYSYSRKIYKPIISSVKVYLNGVPTSTGFVIDSTTGLVTFNRPPATGILITADFMFEVPVRFNTDSIDICYQGKNKYSLQGLELIEINPFQ